LRILLIVNSFATSVTARNTVVVQRRLARDHAVELVETNRRGHATRFASDAARRDVDVVVAFGGDGTLNEVANGLAGTDVPVSVLPGGSTNVVCRTLGIPNDVVDATEHLLALVDGWAPRKIDLGLADGRHFVFSCGVGIDATVVKRVDAHPRLKSRAGPYYYTWATISAFYRQYLVKPVRLRVAIDGKTSEGITALAQNSDPFTYFASTPIRVCEGVEIDDGTLSLGVLKRAAQRDMPTLIPRLFSEKRPGARHRQIEHFEDVTEASIVSISETKDGVPRPFPVQVDGDYIGERTRLDLSVAPGALTIIA
jgi:diacylglycerol kinase family enzyme